MISANPREKEDTESLSSTENYSVVKLSAANWLAIIGTIISGVVGNFLIIYGLNNAALASISESEKDWREELQAAELRWETKLAEAVAKSPPAWVVKDLEHLNAIVLDHEQRLRRTEREVDRIDVQVGVLEKEKTPPSNN